jgi:hypothetical protein
MATTHRLQYGQSLIDVVLQYFGDLNYLVKVAHDNNIAVTSPLEVGTELTIDNEGLGNQEVKNAIIEQNLQFNNDYVKLIEDLEGNFIYEDGNNQITEQNDNLILD